MDAAEPSSRAFAAVNPASGAELATYREATAETGLTEGRLTGELERTARQLEAFGELVARHDSVKHAMHHGGPYPATTFPGFTSVGMTAIGRLEVGPGGD
jgi:hypothetical protein